MAPTGSDVPLGVEECLGGCHARRDRDAHSECLRKIRHPARFTQYGHRRCSPSWHLGTPWQPAQRSPESSRDRAQVRRVDEPPVTPSFDGLASVTGGGRTLPVQTLDAVYYDTAGHDQPPPGSPCGGAPAVRTPAGISNCPPATTRPTLERRSDCRWTGAGDVPPICATWCWRSCGTGPLNGGTHRDHGTYGYCTPPTVRRWPNHRRRVTAGAFPDSGPGPPWSTGGSGRNRTGRGRVTGRYWTSWASACTTPAPPRRARIELASARRGGDGHRTSRHGPPPADPIHRAVAQQVAELITWDRAVRADAYDSVHQMRVTTIATQPAQGVRGVVRAHRRRLGPRRSCRQLASILGWPATPGCSPRSTRRRLDELPADLIRAGRCANARSTGAEALRERLAALAGGDAHEPVLPVARRASRELVTAEPTAADTHAPAEHAR